jgi:NHLM bacteriocin system ABC transporter peptidase/ATP-binding protein
MRAGFVRTPTVLQMEAAECGAAALAMILGHFGRFVKLEGLRHLCGVSRDGSKAANILRAARHHGLVARGFKKEPEALAALPTPQILFWEFNHFVVLEGIDARGARLNDPAAGRRWVAMTDFNESFTGVVLTFAPGAGFSKGGARPCAWPGLVRRLRGYRLTLLFLVLTGAGLIVPALFEPAFTRLFVDDILVQNLRSWLRPLLLSMLAASGLEFLLTLLQQRALVRAEAALSLQGAADFMWHVLRLPCAYFAQRYAVEIAGRVALNDRVAALLSGELAATLLGLASVVFYACVMLQYDTVLTLLVVLFAAVNLVCLWRVSRAMRDMNQKLMMDRGKLQAITVGGFAMAESLKATGSENLFLARWAGFHARVLNAEQAYGRSMVFLSALPPLLMDVSGIVVIVAGGLRVMDGTLSIGMLLAFQTLTILFSQPVTRVVGFGAKILEAGVAIERLDDVFGNALAPCFASTGGTHAGRLSGALAVRGLSFGYTPLDPPLIQNIDLDLPHGGSVALVGGSGSGKSTLAKLLAGLYQPWSGEIRLDGWQFSELSRLSLCGALAFVPQDVALFTASVRDNITLWDTTFDDARIMAAGRDACIHDDVMQREGGYDHRVGEGGRNFSGGQRQRLALARALVRSPSLLILDEATSALDADTEFSIIERLRQRNVSTVIVAHRLSTIRDCDEIIVLDRGRIAERGQHAALMRRGGLYRSLVEQP